MAGIIFVKYLQYVFETVNREPLPTTDSLQR